MQCPSAACTNEKACFLRLCQFASTQRTGPHVGILTCGRRMSELATGHLFPPLFGPSRVGRVADALVVFGGQVPEVVCLVPLPVADSNLVTAEVAAVPLLLGVPHGVLGLDQLLVIDPLVEQGCPS